MLLESDLVKTLLDIGSILVTGANGLARALSAVGGIKTILFALVPILTTVYLPLLKKKTWDVVVSSIASIAHNFKLARASGVSFGQYITNMLAQATAGASALQLAIGGISAAVLITYGIVKSVQQKQEKEVQKFIQSSSDAQQEAQKLAEDVEETSKGLVELVNEYKKLSAVAQDTWDEERITRIQSIQDSIVNLVGDQADGIDLVNGKLKEQLGLLEQISITNYEQAYDKALIGFSDAQEAARKATSIKIAKNTYVVDQNASYRDLFRQEASGFDILLDSRSGAPAIKQVFDSAEEFIKQYEAVQNYKTFLAKNGRNSEDAYSEASLYLDDYKEVYENYVSARDKLDYVSKKIDEFSKQINEDYAGGRVSLKSVLNILDEVQDGFDGLSDALSDVNEYGVLTAKTIENLFKLEEDGKLAGLKLNDILERTADGYTINQESLGLYIQSLLDAYTAIDLFASMQDRANAVNNLINLLAVLKTLSISKDGTKSRKDQLNDEKDALKDNLDAYKELIDLRKKLIKSYQDELDYQKELTKKQQNVSKLQSQLAVAQLDNTAAGRARSRELANELSEAQDELDEFTLDHAVELVLNDLDDQYSEYEKYINGEIDSIENCINNLNESVGLSAEKISEYIASVENAIREAASIPVYGQKTETSGGNIGKLQGNLPFTRYEIHHDGGIVGNAPELKSTESFAKLLKGEFVSTPAQMKNFMEKTLPQITNFSGGTQQFNAPLVEIKCDSITQDSMPKLQEVVDQAVEKVKKVLNNGLSRTGYMKPATSR